MCLRAGGRVSVHMHLRRTGVSVQSGSVHMCLNTNERTHTCGSRLVGMYAHKLAALCYSIVRNTCGQ